MIGISLQLFDESAEQVGLSGIKAIWWDTTDPFGDAVAPIGRSEAVTTDASGYINLDLSSVSQLTVGDWGFLTLYRLDAGNHEDSLVFSGQVQTSDVVSGVVLGQAVTQWVRPTDWVAMPADAANQVCCLVRIDGTDSEYVALKAVAVGGYIVDWGDGTSENVASNVAAEHKYDYADTNLDGTLCSRGYKQAIITITPQGAVNFTELYFNVRHSYYSAGSVSTPFLDMQVNAPGCTVLQSYASNVSFCRYVERWNITALGAQTTQYQMFSGNFSCQSYTFPAGFGAVATSQYQMFGSNYSCQSYIFPAGFGAVATDQGSMFYNNYSCKKLVNNAAEISWSADGMLLDALALIALFESLPTATATLTITGNPGIAGLTAANRLIATAKGWTLVE